MILFKRITSVFLVFIVFILVIFSENKKSSKTNLTQTDILDNILVKTKSSKDSNTYKRYSDDKMELDVKFDKTNKIENVDYILPSETIKNKYSYNNEQITKIDNNGVNYEYLRDDFGNVIETKLNGKTFKQVNEIDSNKKTTFGNGQYIDSNYNNGILTSIKSINTKYLFEYSNNYEKVVSKDYYKETMFNDSNKITNINYDRASFSYEYDDLDNILKTTYQINDKNYIKQNNVILTKDELGRVTNYKVDLTNNKINYEFKYLSNSRDLLFNPLTLIKINENTYSFKYDKAELISITYNNKLIKEYEYDLIGQLITEKDLNLNILQHFTYDKRGNIVTKKKINIKNNTIIEDIKFDYDDSWSDLLTSINGKEIEYDAIGNPVKYNGYDLNWNFGTKLSSISGNNLDATYSYNEQGHRISKVVNGVKTAYYLEDDRVIFEEIGDDVIFYMYDQNNKLIGFEYNNEKYYYIRNNFSDIIQIVNINNEILVNYSYDSWGNILDISGPMADTIGRLNSYLYRGYRYDTETNLYYLGSRYYSPQIGRFINADDIESYENSLSNGMNINLFQYANNNPIKYIDPDGCFAITASAVIIVLCVVAICAIYLLQLMARYSHEISRVMVDCTDELRRVLESIVAAIPGAWAKIVESKKPENHHIVPKGAALCQPARSVLTSVGIDVNNDHRNLIILKYRFHRRLHTNLYMITINSIFRTAYDRYDKVIIRLAATKVVLATINTVA